VSRRRPRCLRIWSIRADGSRRPRRHPYRSGSGGIIPLRPSGFPRARWRRRSGNRILRRRRPCRNRTGTRRRRGACRSGHIAWRRRKQARRTWGSSWFEVWRAWFGNIIVKLQRCQCRSADFQSAVSPNCIRQRVTIANASVLAAFCRLQICETADYKYALRYISHAADWQSAIQQAGSLRYVAASRHSLRDYNIIPCGRWSLRIRAEFVLHSARLWADDAGNKKGICLYGPDGLSQNSVPRDHRVAGRFARHDFLPVSGYG
jgi:hypothetical protein